MIIHVQDPQVEQPLPWLLSGSPGWASPSTFPFNASHCRNYANITRQLRDHRNDQDGRPFLSRRVDACQLSRTTLCVVSRFPINPFFFVTDRRWISIVTHWMLDTSCHAQEIFRTKKILKTLFLFVTGCRWNFTGHWTPTRNVKIFHENWPQLFREFRNKGNFPRTRGK